jgi:ankyrin repeat protein
VGGHPYISQVSVVDPLRKLFSSHKGNTASAGHEDIVRELVGAGADVNSRNDKGITPL